VAAARANAQPELAGLIRCCWAYLTNEEGEVVNTLGERFEAVLVLEYDVPLK
jgi:hypothetical protein